MEKTMKRSRQREAMLALIKGTKCHPNALWLYDEMRKDFPNISLGTVYRNLGVLEQTGEIMRVCTAGGSEHYDGNTNDHCHFICRVCDRVLDIDVPEVHSLAAAAQRCGVSVESCSLIFSGVCKDCRDNNKI